MKNIKNLEITGKDADDPRQHAKPGSFADVQAQAFYRETGKIAAEPRIERINLESNPLFKSCKTVLDIKDAYEAFWNCLNPRSNDIVFVQKVTLIADDML